VLTPRALRAWSLVHEWTSVLATLFLFVLFATGLPLIFWHEIAHWTGTHPLPAELPAETPRAPVDAVVASALAHHAGHVPLYVYFDDEDPLVGITTAPSLGAPHEEEKFASFDARTAQVAPAPAGEDVVMTFLYRLHVDLFLGLPGTLFMGAIGLLLVASIVSGVVLYAPFARKLAFGEVRTARSRRTRWLDLHNLLGIVTLAWGIVLAATGFVNALAEPLFAVWAEEALGELRAAAGDRPVPARLAPLEDVVVKARAAAPGNEPSFVAFPGTEYASSHHYVVFLRGETPLTHRILKPAVFDAETGALVAVTSPPWYMTMLFVAQPLHFGDYGGMALKIVWALLDLATIAVLATGLYLWLGRMKRPFAERYESLVRGEEPA
jgi:uncharacterized iron-regulated membrane protein